METSTDPKDAPAGVECRPSKDPAVQWFIVAGMLLGWGGYCFVDAYIRHLPKKVETINEVLTYWHNRGGAFLFPLLGLLLVIKTVIFLRRKLVADQAGLGYLGKEKIPWGDITSLDTAKFKKKGILGLRYTRDGKEKTFVLDSWKLNNFRQLIQLVEAKVPFALPE